MKKTVSAIIGASLLALSLFLTLSPGSSVRTVTLSAQTVPAPAPVVAAPVAPVVVTPPVVAPVVPKAVVPPAPKPTPASVPVVAHAPVVPVVHTPQVTHVVSARVVPSAAVPSAPRVTPPAVSLAEVWFSAGGGFCGATSPGEVSGPTYPTKAACEAAVASQASSDPVVWFVADQAGEPPACGQTDAHELPVGTPTYATKAACLVAAAPKG